MPPAPVPIRLQGATLARVGTRLQAPEFVPARPAGRGGVAPPVAGPAGGVVVAPPVARPAGGVVVAPPVARPAGGVVVAAPAPALVVPIQRLKFIDPIIARRIAAIPMPWVGV